MAIKYYHIPEKRKTIGVLNNTKWDAVNKIDKMLGHTSMFVDGSKYIMSDSFRAVAVCDKDDMYSKEEGERIVREKLLNKYYKQLDCKIMNFVSDVNAACSAAEVASKSCKKFEKNA